MAQAKPSTLSYGFNHAVDQKVNFSWSIKRDSFDIPKKSTVFHELAGSWIEQVVREKNIDLRAINGGCCLNQIVIYEPGNHYIKCQHKPQNTGSSPEIFHYFNGTDMQLTVYLFLIGHFGSVSLQIPVEKGHRGGRLTIRSKDTEDVLELSHKSDMYFYVSFIKVGNEHWIEPITDGYRIELEYSLFWRGKCSPALPDISSFLTTLVSIKFPFQFNVL